MAKIEHNKLTKMLKVWYNFERYHPVSGPFTVRDFYSDHEGRHVMLGSGTLTDRAVLLADDDDIGFPIFYDTDPATP